MRSTHEMYEVAARYRGNLLNEVSWMEKFLDTYISQYFVGKNKKKTRDMHYLILGDVRISLENKKQIFHYLAETYDLDWYNSYISIIPKEKKSKAILMNRDFIRLIEARSIFAHRVIDTSIEGRNDLEAISFLTYKNEPGFVRYTENDFEEIMFIARDITKHLHDRTQKK